MIKCKPLQSLFHLLLVLSLSSCAVHQSSLEKINAVESRVTDQISAMDDRSHWSDELYIAADQFNLVDDQLPEFFNLPISITQAVPTELSNILQLIERESGHSLLAAQDVYEQSGTRYPFVFSGDLKGALNHLAQATKVSWSFENNQINLYRYQTRTFVIDAISASTQFNATAKSGQSSGSQQSSAQNKHDLSITSKVDPLVSMQSSVEGMLSSKGKATISTVSNTITVTDYPGVLDRVAEMIEQINARSSRSIVLDFEVITISNETLDSLGLTIDFVFENLSGLWGSALNSTSGNDQTQSRTFQSSIIDPNYNYSGTSFTADAINKITKSATTRREVMSVAVNQPSSIHIGTARDVVTSTENTVVPNVGVVTSTEKRIINTGLVLDLIPTVLSDNSIQMAIQVDISDLVALEVFETGTGRLQNPVEDKIQKTMISKLKDGETGLVAAYVRNTTKQQQTGTGKPSVWALGGGVNSASDTEHVLVLMTPHLEH